MRDFELLKRTYPISRFNRQCDGYDYILKYTSADDRVELGIELGKLQRIIKEGEKYIYQVAKDEDDFKIMCLSFSNYEIIRNTLFNEGEDD